MKDEVIALILPCYVTLTTIFGSCGIIMATMEGNGFLLVQSMLILFLSIWIIVVLGKALYKKYKVKMNEMARDNESECQER
jgi:hypothetical protein